MAGDSAMGAQRWIALGPFKFQPSEFARMSLALILAMFFGENRRGARNTSDLVIGGIFVIVLFALNVKQPDLGSAMTLLPVFLGVAYLAGLRLRLYRGYSCTSSKSSRARTSWRNASPRASKLG